MGRKLTTIILITCLCSTMLAGCKDKSKNVNYSIDADGTSIVENTIVTGNKGISQYKDLTNWSDSYTLTRDDGETIPVNIDCGITIPNTTQMSVIEGTFISFDPTFMESTIKKIFGNNPVYYYDYTRRPKDDMDEAVIELTFKITETERDIEDGYHTGEYLDYFKKYLENLKTELNKCKEILNKNTCSNEYISVTDYDSDTYIGEINGKMYILKFSNTIQGLNGYENIIREISLNPKDIKSVAPQKCIQYNAMCLSQNNEAMKNNCKYNKNEAIDMAKKFMADLSFTDHVFCKAFNLMWECGDNLDEYGTVESNKYAEQNGYSVMFTQPIDKDNSINSNEQNDIISIFNYNKFSCNMGNEQHAVVAVNDNGIVMMSIDNSFKITSHTKETSLIPFDSLKEILKTSLNNQIKKKTYLDDLESGDSLDFKALELKYLLVSESTQSDNFSYIPVWQLKGDNNDYSIFINAIDGTYIDVSDLILESY